MKNSSKSHSRQIKPDIFSKQVRTKWGPARIGATERGIARISFPSRARLKNQSVSFPKGVKNHLSACRAFLISYFSGKRNHNNSVRIDWQFFTPFERTVLRRLQSVPEGKTISYSELARKSGVPRAARAVGNALNRNPVPILLPCHRVVQKSGAFGGYRGGAKLKSVLLLFERQKVSIG